MFSYENSLISHSEAPPCDYNHHQDLGLILTKLNDWRAPNEESRK